MAQNTPVEMVRHASTLSVFVVLLGAFTRTFFQGKIHWLIMKLGDESMRDRPQFATPAQGLSDLLCRRAQRFFRPNQSPTPNYLPWIDHTISTIAPDDRSLTVNKRFYQPCTN